MAYLFGIPTLVFVVVLVYGGITGRITMSSCCAVADPAKDLRMRAAFQDAESSSTSTASETPDGGRTPVESDRR